MNIKIVPIIQVEELLELYKTKNIVIVDASNGKNAKENYNKKHLDTAQFIDLNTQLATIPDNFADGGRHPLPSIEKFAKTLQQLGITINSHVIVYDDKNGANAAARFWWMLKSIGHEKVQVLNGGIQEAEKVNFPINNTIEIPKAVGVYKYEDWKLKTVTIKNDMSISTTELRNSITTYSLSDIPFSNNKLDTKFKQLKVFLSPTNISNAIYHGRLTKDAEITE